MTRSYFFVLSHGDDPDIRVDGDIVIEVDYTGQGDPNNLGFYTWDGTPPVMSDYIAVLEAGVPVADAPELAAFFDLSPVEYFGEMAIDLTGLGLVPNTFEIDSPDDCEAFGFGRAISRTGNGKTATLKDDGEPARIDIEVCGTIIVNKAVTESIPTSETFPASLALPAGVIVPGAAAFNLVVPGGATSSAPVVFENIPVTTGTSFTLSEDLSGALGDRWDLVGIVCQNDNGDPATGATFDLAAGETVTCTITNDPEPAEIHVTKVVDPGDGGSTEWDIAVTGQAVRQISDGETLDYTDLDAGDFIVTETDPPNADGEPPFDAVGWSCSINGGTAFVQSGTSIGFSLAPGDVANCTITNELIPEPQVLVTKTAAPTSFQEGLRHDRLHGPRRQPRYRATRGHQPHRRRAAQRRCLRNVRPVAGCASRVGGQRHHRRQHV